MIDMTEISEADKLILTTKDEVVVLCMNNFTSVTIRPGGGSDYSLPEYEGVSYSADVLDPIERMKDAYKKALALYTRSR